MESLESLKKEQQKYYVKKNYIDPTAAVVYVLGCSLVHATLFIMMLIIAWPDIDRASKLDTLYVSSECSREA
jgi:hypothetical protein